MWSARRNLASCKSNPEDPERFDWCKKWYEAYFGFRREYEGYGTFVIEKY
jgi:hypothetical protein